MDRNEIINNEELDCGEFDDHWNERVQNVLRDTFKLDSLRYNQSEVIKAAMDGHDCFVIMPTGGGKSLCYQLPAVLSTGVTIVISPLKSLMADQVDKLRDLNILASYLKSEMTQDEKDKVYEDLETPDIKLLYVTPEMVMNGPRLKLVLDDLYRRDKIARFVVDETHLVVDWGDSFRKEYRKLGQLRDEDYYPKTPFMAVTATAKPTVVEDIVQNLKMQKCKRFISGFNRKNLSYEIREKTNNISEDIRQVIMDQFHGQSGIVYCRSREGCNLIAKQLEGIGAAAYHAGLDENYREQVQQGWMDGHYKVVCATVAFGMGVDKADVRFVIHHSLPTSVPDYYQQTGRAGRDGAPAACLLYYSPNDVWRLLSPEERQNLMDMAQLCETDWKCRRVQLLEYFGEQRTAPRCAEDEQPCDVCRACWRDVDRGLCEAVAGAVSRAAGDHTMLQLVKALRGTEKRRHLEDLHGLCKTWPQEDVQSLLRQFLGSKVLYKKEINYGGNRKIINYLKTTEDFKTCLQSNVFRRKSTLEDLMMILEDECFKQLVEVRSTLEVQRGASLSRLCSDDALRVLALLAVRAPKLPRALPAAELVANVDDLLEGLGRVTDEYYRKGNELREKYTHKNHTLLVKGKKGNPKAKKLVNRKQSVGNADLAVPGPSRMVGQRSMQEFILR